DSVRAASPRARTSARRLPAGRRDEVHHPGHAEAVDQRTEARRPERRAEGHDDLAALGEGIEHLARLGGVLGLIRDVEAVLGLADVRGELRQQVGAYDGLVADL